MTEPDWGALADQIRAKLEAQDVVIDEKIEARLADKDFVRKTVFGGDPQFTSSKFRGLSVGDVEVLHMLMTSTRMFGGPGPSKELDAAFDAVTKGHYASVVGSLNADRRQIEDAYGSGRLTKPGFEQAMRAVEWNSRAMDTAESGYGSQLIGAQYVPELWAGAGHESRVFSQIPQFTMTAPTAYLPVAAALPELLFVSESTASNSSNYTTSKAGSQRVQVDAYKFVLHLMYSGEMAEDSIIAFLPFLRGQAVESLAYYSDSLVLNGDTTNASTLNINSDDADPADTKHYLAFDGLRHVGLVDNTNNQTDVAGALDVSHLFGAKGLMLDRTYMNDWGHPGNPADLVFVAEPSTADAIAQFDEVISLDKFGPQATIQTGQVASILGHPVIGSIALGLTDADGKISTATPTKGSVVAFNRRGFTVGVRRTLQVAFEPIPATDQFRIVYSTRLGFGRWSPTGAASGIESAAVLYDITV